MSLRPNRIFLLSPASCSGRRAEILIRDQASFALAERIRSQPGASLGEVFSFLSGLYFRGKLAYSERFRSVAEGLPTTLVITGGRGLLPPETAITSADLRAFASVPIDIAEARYREPFERDLRSLVERLGDQVQIVLLGSIASAKYRTILTDIARDQVYFPADFIGRGDMSRGGLMLRCAENGEELPYVPLAGAELRGTRPAKLTPKKRNVL